MKKVIFALSLIVITLSSCEQSEPDFNNRNGDILQFAGRNWIIKHSSSVLLGPGPNFFSDHPNDIWVDEKGYLHLTITEREDVWHSTEVGCEDYTGYGTYIFTVQGDVHKLDPNIVLGLFTWDYNTFKTQANSEVDIEFSKWSKLDQDTTLQYGVQPINFGVYYPERDDKPKISSRNWDGISTHGFTWTDSLITWESYKGEQYGVGEKLASWSFDLNNPPRRKFENNELSDPIVIPKPGTETHARMNLWLVGGPNLGPVIPIRSEVIIRDFKYIPL